MGIWPMGANRKSQKFIFLAKKAEKCRDACILLNVNVINVPVIIKIFEPPDFECVWGMVNTAASNWSSLICRVHTEGKKQNSLTFP